MEIIIYLIGAVTTAILATIILTILWGRDSYTEKYEIESTVPLIAGLMAVIWPVSVPLFGGIGLLALVGYGTAYIFTKI